MLQKENDVLMGIPAEYDGAVSSVIWNYYTSILTTPHTHLVDAHQEILF